MKNFIFVLLFLAHMSAFSQVSDNFSDGQFKSVPGKDRPVEWTGDVENFVVNGNLQLQLNAPTNGSPSQLRTHSELSANVYWEFWAKMDLNSTSSNYVRVYLYSDGEDLTATTSNGLFIRLGHTNKNVSLIQAQSGKSNKTLIEGTSKRLDNASVSLRLKATLDKSGKFNLYSKLDDESDYVLEGSCKIADPVQAQNFGVVCNFSSTRNKSFYFDDFLARTLRDDEQDNNPDPGNPDALSEGDVIFSEVMANPGGSNPEYIELYNASEKTFNLKNYLYYYGDNSYKLPDGEINPGEYFVLSKTTTTGSFPDARVFGVTSFPALANAGKLLMFTTDKGELISWFEYSDAMYGSAEKKSGGWSLECIDLQNKSNIAANWIGSNEASGTPGRENSVKRTNPDVEIPRITGVQTLENNALKLTFSKPMNRGTLLEKNSYTISNVQYSIEDLQTDFPKGTELTIRFSTLPPEGELIELVLEGVRDLSELSLVVNHVLVGSGSEASPGDVVINEILFNPPTGGNEYVEIYNKSGKALDLRFLSITSRKPSDGSLNKAYPLADTPLLLQPDDYLVITKSKDLVCAFFDCRPTSRYAELSVMPSLANTSGCAVLLNNKTNEVIDEFAYNEKMHSEGISNKKGVALERVDFNRTSDDAGNWLSASAQSGFGTPGYKNSQQSDQTGIVEDITVSYPEIDFDNYRIHYHLNSPGYRCQAYVFDSLGRIVNTVANNELLGTEGDLIWNGKGGSGQKLTSGIYIIYVEVYDMKGSVKKFRKPTVVK